MGTALVTLAIALAGVASYFALPVAALPEITIPAIVVQAALPGASPEVMATSVAAPLEHRFGEMASLTDLFSSSSSGAAQIIMLFDLDRDINGAARDVEAAINAARIDLPTSLRSNPTYRKINPAEAPIVILNLSSETMPLPKIYDKAATVIQQRLSQIEGVGSVDIAGAANPAVRVELNPFALSHYGISPEDLRAAVSSANLTSPKGAIVSGGRTLQLYTNDQGFTADDYKSLVVAYRDGAAVRLSDVARVVDDAENPHNLNFENGKRSISVRVTKTPGANVIATVERIKATLPQIQAQLYPISLSLSIDRTITIRASLIEVGRTLFISIALVILVVLLFLRDGRATLIPGLAVVVSLLGTLAVMALCRFSLDNLSLMALTVATGFVVDDAIVVLENITRLREAGASRLEAALRGAREVAFTVTSMSLSLIAVFMPILFLPGLLGRLFREFAVTLSASILISLFVSLTSTPMLAAWFTKETGEGPSAKRRASLYGRIVGGASNGLEQAFVFVHETYGDSLLWALKHRRIVLLSLLGAILATWWLYIAVPKGFIPQEDTGQLQGNVQVDQASSFLLTQQKYQAIVDTIKADPAVDTVTAFSGSGSNGIFVQLKPPQERGGLTSDEVITRLRPKLARISGADTFLQTVQDLQIGGRPSAAQYQYTLESDDLHELQTWADRLASELKSDPALRDVNSDAQPHGLETMININYAAAARLGLTVQQIDNTLADSFGQSLISTIYNPLNQYHVVMEIDPKMAATPSALDDVYVSTSNAAGSNLTSGSGSRPSGTGTASAVLPQPVGVIIAARTQTARTIATSSGITTPPRAFEALSSPLNALQSSAIAVNRVAATTATLVGGLSVSSGLSGAGSTAAATGGGRPQTGIAVSTTKETVVPLSAFATYTPEFTPISVAHQDQQVATTLSYNLAPGKSLSDATKAIEAASSKIHLPLSVHGGSSGAARQFAQSLATEPLLILAALAAVYIVLGILYESYIHPLTALSTLPSAGAGAVAALMIFHVQFDLIGLIGVILLIGIVKKNAIMIIDFALIAERKGGLSTSEAIYQACMLRFRPILMTTFAAILGAVPLALGLGVGGEFRRPLGLAIIGGLVVSQVLTLLTTPVVYLYLDRLRKLKPKGASKRRDQISTRSVP